MEIRSRQDARSVCIKSRHGAISAGEVLEEERFVCYLKAVALISLRGLVCVATGTSARAFIFIPRRKPAFSSLVDSRRIVPTDPGYGRGVPFWALLFQWPGVTRASNPFVPMRFYVFFMFFIGEINSQCKGDLCCSETNA